MTQSTEAASLGDLTNLGLSTRAHDALKSLKANGVLDEMADGYRLGVALAVSFAVTPPPLEDRVNVFGVATVDPTGELRSVVESLYEHTELTPYRLMERLADWGVRELENRYKGASLDLADVVGEDV